MQQVLIRPMLLRTCYAMPGTDTGVLPMLLCTGYAMSGTDAGVLCDIRYCPRARSASSRGRAVLTQAMLLAGQAAHSPHPRG
eukprot:71721-Rhodomonas_salina.1